MKSLLNRTGARYSLVVLITALVIAPTAVLASHSFADVPDSHTFHNDIDWMADNGITSGCGDGSNYCPDAGVTRGQMAAFMRRLATKQVVDAGTLQGTLPVAANFPVAFSFDSTTTVEAAKFDIVTPGPGTLLITVSGNVWVNADASSADALIAQGTLSLCSDSRVICAVTTVLSYEDPDDNNGSNGTIGISLTAVISVSSAGVETVYLNGISHHGFFINDTSSVVGTAIFLPGDGTSVLPVTSTQSPSATVTSASNSK